MHGSAHGHHHDHHSHTHEHAPGGAVRFGAAFALGAALNTALVAAQIGAGLWAHSAALLADAVHNLGDVLALLLAWGAAWLGTWLPSARRTYGWGRASILAALVNAAVLLVGVGAIGVEALHRLAAPEPVAGGIVIVVAVAGIAVNGVTAWLFAHGRADLNVRAAFQHMAADAVVSAGVALAGAAVLLTGRPWIDPLASLAIVAVIVAGTWSTLTQSMDLAMDAVPGGVATAEVSAFLGQLPGVQEVHDLHIWALSTSQTALTAHLVRLADAPCGAEALAEQAALGLRERFAIGHATIQVETETMAHACPLRPAAVV